MRCTTRAESVSQNGENRPLAACCSIGNNRIAQCDQQLQAQIAPIIDDYGVATMPTELRPKNCRAQLHNAKRKASIEPQEAFSWCGEVRFGWPAIAAHRGSVTRS